MVPSVLGLGISGCQLPVYRADPVHEQNVKQPAVADASRLGYRNTSTIRSSNPMRVVKPSSASNSPQNCLRRRSLMNDSNQAIRRQQMLDRALQQQQQQQQQQLQQQLGDEALCGAYPEFIKRTSRPVSWHPNTSYQTQIQQYQRLNTSHILDPVLNAYSELDIYSAYQPYPPTPAVYSVPNSPQATFSPLEISHPLSYQSQPVPPLIPSFQMERVIPMSQQTQYADATADLANPYPSYAGHLSCSWDVTLPNYSCTAPPTPDNFQRSERTEPAVSAGEFASYQPLDEPEEEGEILVGMGLYDAPDSKTESDPGLGNYLTSTSQLLGTTYRRGVGLKLEEAWDPPEQSDGEEEDSYDEEDAHEA